MVAGGRGEFHFAAAVGEPLGSNSVARDSTAKEVHGEDFFKMRI
jgi:hypothetical protein